MTDKKYIYEPFKSFEDACNWLSKGEIFQNEYCALETTGNEEIRISRIVKDWNKWRKFIEVKTETVEVECSFITININGNYVLKPRRHLVCPLKPDSEVRIIFEREVKEREERRQRIADYKKRKNEKKNSKKKIRN